MGMRALLFDVDNTLTDTNHRITERTKKALRVLAKKNIRMGVCTGRSYAELVKSVLPLFPFDALHVVSGGAQVVSSYGKVYWEKKLPSSFVHATLEKALAMGGDFVFCQGSFIYGTPSEQARKLQIDKESQIAFPQEEEDWSTCLLSLSNISQAFLSELEKDENILVKSMVRSNGEPYCDITPAGVTKATGLQVWAQFYGLPLTEIMGFGDSENDAEFLQIVGTSVAMGNARADIRERADLVIGHTNDEGLAEYLETLVEV